MALRRQSLLAIFQFPFRHAAAALVVLLGCSMVSFAAETSGTPSAGEKGVVKSPNEA